MADTLRDQQVVEIQVTQTEMNALLAAKAKAAGIIAFDAEQTQVEKTNWADADTGERVEGYVITFRRESV